MGVDPYKNDGRSPAAQWGNRVLLGLFAVAAAAMAALIAMSFIVPPMLQGVVDDFTEHEPTTFAEAAIPEADREAVEARFEAFEKAVDEGTPVEPLGITDRELNGLLAESDDTRDKVRLEFRDGLLHARMSIRIDNDLEIGPWRGQMQGRYLNGTAVLEPSIDSNGLSVTLTDFVVKGESVPGWMHSALQHEIDKLDWLHSEDVVEAVSKLESVQIEGDRLVLHPKR